MSLGGTRVDAIDVGAILAGVDEGLVVLPDFQRLFDWSEADTIAVLATILTKWPIGSLLLLEGAPGYLRTRPFNGAADSAKSAAIADVEYVVLDGQQRITSLFHALWDRGKRVFAINLASLEADPSPENLEEAIETIARPRWLAKFETPADQLRQGYVPIYALKNPSEFFKWRDSALDQLDEPDRGVQYDRVSDLYRDLFSGLDRYRVPAIIVPKSTPAGAIARIFERVNKTGQKLRTFDLMVAITYDGTFNLREEWDRARLLDAPIVGEFFGENGMPSLHVLSLQLHDSLRDSSVLQMKGREVRINWPRSIECLASTATFARRYLGMHTVQDAPNINSLLVLAGLASTKDLESNHEQFERWFWATTFASRYDIASNTRAASDYKELRSSQQIEIPTVVMNREETLRSTRRQRGAFHRAFAAFTASRLPSNELPALAGLKFESVIGATDEFARKDDLESPPDATLSFAWKRSTTKVDETNEDTVVDPDAQLLSGGASSTLGLVERRLENLASALKEMQIPVRLVSTEDDV